MVRSYDSELDSRTRKAIGAFYTPDEIVSEMCSLTLAPRLREARTAAEVLSTTVYDPSCGDGRFLLSARHLFLSRLAELGFEKADASGIVEAGCLYGADIDPGALRLARRQLPAANLACLDSLTAGPSRRHDIVIGNPPYGARTSSGGESAREFIEHALKALAPGGAHSFIVPKALVFASTWRPTLERILAGLTDLLDCGKAWREVKLEQVIYVYRDPLAGRKPTYRSGAWTPSGAVSLGELDKESAAEFGFVLNGITSEELCLGRRIRASGAMLGDFSTNSRGAPLQAQLNARGSRPVLGGRDLARFRISDAPRRHLPSGVAIPPRARVVPNDILAQNVVAHVTRPSSHLKITAALAWPGETLVLDTINKINWTGPYSTEAAVAILNSSLVSWYVYRFVVGRAIRTIHFDSPITSRIPMPRAIAAKADDELAGLAREMRAAPGEATFAQIDRLVCGLYGLGKREARAVRV